IASFILYGHTAARDPHSFPTRRSSDLRPARDDALARPEWEAARRPGEKCRWEAAQMTSATGAVGLSNSDLDRILGLMKGADSVEDRKSTRLNSSHQISSYAVFCLKKKN